MLRQAVCLNREVSIPTTATRTWQHVDQLVDRVSMLLRNMDDLIKRIAWWHKLCKTS